MNEPKHTPGPWAATQWKCHAPTAIRANGITIAETSGFGESIDLCIANARLIAAAPELLEALKQSALVLSGMTMTKVGVIAALVSARDAISRAEGRIG